MRSRTSSLVFVFCLAAGAAFAACSGETTENPGGDGGSGASGSAGTTSSTTGATTSTTTSASATSSGAGGDGGGATVCDQACDKADECGLPVCDALPFDCADPAAECSAQCVVGATCEQIASLEEGPADQELTDCLNECQGSEGGSAVECLSCANQSGCLDACGDDTSCQIWLLCALGCMRNDPQPQCFSGCNADYVGTPTEEMIDAVYACTCTDCNESCDTAVDPCNQ